MGNFEREPLDELEEVRGVFYGGVGQVGQQFVVTNRRLLLAPLKLVKNIENDVAIEAAGFVAGRLQVPGAELVGKILTSYAPFDPRTVWLRHIVEVRAGRGSSLFRAPELIYTTDTEDVETLGVVKSTWTPNISPANIKSRDNMIEVLRSAVAAAKAAPGGPI